MSLLPLFSWRSAIAESDLPPVTRHVALALSLYMNERGGSAFPGRTRLARDTGLHADTVKRALRNLRDAGYIEVVHEGGSDVGGRRRAAEYRAVSPETSQGDRVHPADSGPPAHDPPRPPAHDPPHLFIGTLQDQREPKGSLAAQQKLPDSQQLPDSQTGTDLVLVDRSTPSKRQRRVDVVWDAMLAVCGVTAVTSSARGAYNRSAADLRAVGATAETIGQRANVFRERWPDVSLTPTALARRWGECDPSRQHTRAASRREREDADAIEEALDRVYGTKDPDHDPRSAR